MSPPPQLFNWEDLGAGPEVAPQCFKRVLSENGKWGGRQGRRGKGGALCSQRAQPVKRSSRRRSEASPSE